MSAIEGETAAAPTEATGTEASAANPPESGEPEPNSRSSRKKRAPYTRAFRGFLEQLGENPREFDQFRRGFWDDFDPQGSFEEDLVEDLVENRWKLRRLNRTHQAKLVEIRRRTELKRQRRLASESREEDGMAEKWLMTTQGVTALPDSHYKFEKTILFLIGLRAKVELEGFTDWGTGCLRVIFGESPGLSASDLARAYDAGIKTQAEGDEDAKHWARVSFMGALAEEIKAYQKLQALYREGEIEIPEATRDAQMLLDEKDLGNMLRQERMLELEYQLKLEQWSAWRRGKQGAPEGSPQGGRGGAAPDFGSARGGGAGQLARGRGSVGRAAGRPLSNGGLSL